MTAQWMKNKAVLVFSLLLRGSSTEGKGDTPSWKGKARGRLGTERPEEGNNRGLGWWLPAAHALTLGRPRQHDAQRAHQNHGRALSFHLHPCGLGSGSPWAWAVWASFPGLQVLPGSAPPPFTALFHGAPGPAQLSRVGTCAVPASVQSAACLPQTSCAAGLDAPSWSLGAARRKS